MRFDDVEEFQLEQDFSFKPTQARFHSQPSSLGFTPATIFFISSRHFFFLSFKISTSSSSGNSPLPPLASLVFLSCFSRLPLSCFSHLLLLSSLPSCFSHLSPLASLTAPSHLSPLASLTAPSHLPSPTSCCSLLHKKLQRNKFIYILIDKKILESFIKVSTLIDYRKTNVPGLKLLRFCLILSRLITC